MRKRSVQIEQKIAQFRLYKGPVLIVHGKNDKPIPYKHGLTLYKAARQGTLLAYDCGHNDCPPDWDKFFQDIEPILRKVGL